MRPTAHLSHVAGFVFQSCVDAAYCSVVARSGVCMSVGTVVPLIASVKILLARGGIVGKELVLWIGG